MKTFRNFRENILEFIQSRGDTAKKQGISVDREIDPDSSKENALIATQNNVKRITDKYKKPQRPTPTQGHVNAQAHDEVKGNEFRTGAPSPRTKVLGGNQNASDINRQNRYNDAYQKINKTVREDLVSQDVANGKGTQEELERLWNEIPAKYKLGTQATKNQSKIRQIARVMEMASDRNDKKLYQKLHQRLEKLLK